MNTFYPELFEPISTEIFPQGDNIVLVPRTFVRFHKWEGIPLNETFGNKSLLNIEGEAVFAELAIMKSFVSAGWDARWVETYARGNKEPLYLKEWKDVKYREQTECHFADELLRNLIKEIAAIKGSYGGCWDVAAHKNGKVLFIESKWLGKDSINSNQRKWLEAAMRFGLTEENFLVVEWDYKQ